MTSFKQWCLMKFSTSEAANATHIFMDKGKINVPTNDYPEFLRFYFHAIAYENISLVEKLGVGCIMRFFLDIDCKNNQENFSEILYDISTCANEAVGIVGDVYSCTEKQGIHIIYNKVVTCDSAIELASKISSNLSEGYKKYIDLSVYKTGLRMVGSTKYVSGKVDTRVYLPMHNDFTFELLKRSIVRIKTNVNINNSAINVSSGNIFENFIANEFGVSLKIITMKKLGNFISCTTDSKYCINIGKNHKNSKVYYVFDLQKRSCYQKCFCPCLKPIVFTSCKNFKSKPVNVPYIIVDALLHTC